VPTSIRPRLLLFVGLALAPVALASMVQAILNFRAYQSETDRILIQTALYAAYSEQNIFTRAEQLLRSLARRPDATRNATDCYRELSDALVGAMPIINLTRVDAAGRVICMGAVSPDHMVYARLSWWDELHKSDHIIVGNQFSSRILKRALLPIALPIMNASGRFDGAISASVDLDWLESAPQVTKLPEGALSMILDGDGKVLASNRTIPAELPSAVLAKRKGAHERVFTVNSDAGKRWRWVVEPIGISDKYVAFGIPEPRLLGTFRWYLLADVLLTLAIVAATCAAIWLGTEWLVLRWTIYLKRVAVAYGRNHFTLSLDDMKNAPDEFRLLGREMKRMAMAIQDRDRNLSLALEQQSAMTREIHHRVKNNLQIVSSLIAIYAQNIANPVAKGAFRQIIARVDALTLIQRQIERNESEPILNMPVLFEQLAEQIRTLAAESNQIFRLTLDVEPRWLPPDTATPIVLFAIEALSFDIFLPWPDTRTRTVRLAFFDGPAGYVLHIEDATAGALPTPGSLSARILRSLSDQLRGRYTIEADPAGGEILTLRIPRDSNTPVNNEEDTNVFALSRSRQV
jgi:two-component sensor histidine kinase